MTTEKVETGFGADVEMPRLDAADELEVRQAFVWHQHGYECSDQSFDDGMARARVQYRDDFDAGTSEYQVYDTVSSYGDGWRLVS